MSNDLDTIRRLQAWHEGCPIPHGSVINLHVADDDDIVIAAFVRMGGESRPWGVAIGTRADGPRYFTVPEARNRDLVADMMLDVAPILLGHFRHPRFSADGPAGFQTQTLRQIWVPGPTHLEMLHFIAAAYARTKWERPGVDTLRALGNLANCLFIESQRPGQQSVVSATHALRSSYVFPTSPVRQGHVGHLLGWLRGGRTRDTRWKTAHDAERESVSTVLDPEVERRELEPFVAEWGENKSTRAAEAIDSSLRVALERRWVLTSVAIDELRRDPRSINPNMSRLVSASARSFHFRWGERVMNEEAGENPFWPNVFTDHNARSAAASFHSRVVDDDEVRSLLVHGDTEMQREELAAGHGVLAEVVSASTDRWTIEYSYPDLTTIEPGKTLVIAGQPTMRLDVDAVDLDQRRMVLVPKWKYAKKSGGALSWASDSTKWRGTRLVLLADSPIGVMRRKITAAMQRVDDDITSFLLAPQARHAAYDDDGVVVEAVEADS